ncbi:c-type cytochrome [Martelella mediterranea]|uniref:Nicotinate dehydrogenase subunit B n=1 Tax=Martelella mediterranea DSM 17316 TaxID=1122214 RepID=A0A1U9Z3J7_9HYPH|nr:c-type cytochrome [Martelella mediterranea]AQZ52220.1 Nicotinate dehydrogenase subunit B [Martelella mediterranea DSM 17316]
MAFALHHKKAWLGTLAVVAVGCAAVVGAYVYQPAIPPIARPDPSDFSPAEVARGEQLAAIGDCAVCHTQTGGAVFAGSRPLATPFGTVFSSNITPDVDTGIGDWSAAAFRRTMKDGVRRDGAYLYPAFPYNHFTNASDSDIDAIYAFLMSRDAVSAPKPANQLIPPLGFRPVLAGWNLLFLRHDKPKDMGKHSDEWERGRYLVNGLGHCGGCHTPRNLLGAEESGKALTGGTAEGYRAPPLDHSNPMAASWTADALFHYLKTGEDPAHGAAAGPMAPVTQELARVNDHDVHAIAVYIASLMEGDDGAEDSAIDEKHEASKAASPTNSQAEGAMLFAGSCGGCHGDDTPMQRSGQRAPLSVVTALSQDDPSNAIQALMKGIGPAKGAGSYMPAFRDSLDDQDMAALLNYARQNFADKPGWDNLEKKVSEIRKEDQE